MKWSRDGAHVLFSDEGYKIARYRVGEDIYYRPSLRGDFISAPLISADDAKAECKRHFEGGGGMNHIYIGDRQLDPDEDQNYEWEDTFGPDYEGEYNDPGEPNDYPE